MKKILYIIILAFLSNAYSQQSGRAVYKTILAKNGYAPITEELIFQKDEATYKLIKKTNPDKVTINEETGEVSLNSQTPDSVHPVIFSNFKNNYIFSKVFLTENDGETYKGHHIKEHVFGVKWKLHSETASINGYNCKKATTNFRGRKYISWYTEEIPLSIGPWKFHGLPGLIIKIQDSENEVTFLLERIQLPFKIELEINPSIFYNSISVEEFEVLRSIAKTKSRKFIKSKMLAKLPRGATIELSKEGSNEIEKKF